MRPKHRVWCPDCQRPKMLFETERKAQDFIQWNGDDMEYGADTLRAYYCPACCGWHISHRGHRSWYDRQTEQMIHRIKEHQEQFNPQAVPDLYHVAEYYKAVGVELTCCCLQAYGKDFIFTQEEVKEIIEKED